MYSPHNHYYDDTTLDAIWLLPYAKDDLDTIKSYYYLTKPGIIQGNLLMATAGFLLASPHRIDVWTLLALLVGTTLVIGSGCVFNNYLDRDIDKKMARTKKRALVTHKIPVVNALVYAALLLVVGFGVLVAYTNWFVVLIGATGFVDYVVIYGWAKRHTVHSTLIGGVSGAASALAGYCAASGQFDKAALLVLLIMSAWQMAHFYGIGIRRRADYKAAGLPILPVVKGVPAAKRQTICYMVLFIVASSLLTVFGYTGYVYLVVMLILGFAWLIRALRTYNQKDDTLWGKQVFLFSLIVLLVTSVMLSVGARLP